MGSNADNTTACDATMAAMSTNLQQQMGQHVADHNASMAATRRANDGVIVKRNERINLRKLTNKQKLRNMAQGMDAQCSDAQQRQSDENILHFQRMKVLSFNHAGKTNDAMIRNAVELEEKRQRARYSALAQRKKVKAVNQRHHQNIAGEQLRHGKEMWDMNAANKAKSAKHATKMGRMQNKGKHKSDDMNHMALQFVAREDKLKQSNERCAVHERTLADNARTVERCQKRRPVLMAQCEVVEAVKATIEKHRAEAANRVKRSKFASEREGVLFTQNQIKCALNASDVFCEEMALLMEELSIQNAQMR